MSEVYLVFGAGKSGIAAVDLLLRLNEKVCLYDGNVDLDVDQLRSDHPSWSEVPIYAGEISDEVLSSCTIAVLSPGVPTDLPIVDRLRGHGLKIWGEVELAYRLGRGSVCAITGTNGKTTTTALTGEIMKTHFDSVFVVGNIGTPYTELCDQMREDSVVVAEISSFMLETIEEFHPRVSAILNITPDHLNRHHTMENYIKAKEDIIKNQTEKDVVVLNYEDPVLREFGESLTIPVAFFSSERVLPGGLYVENGKLVTEFMCDKTEILSVMDLNILGKHNYENALAAVAMAQAMKVPMDMIRKGLSTFEAVEHRIEFTCEKRGVRFYNDSKGTNPDASIKAVDAMDRPTLLIGGGYDKASDFDEWASHFPGKVKKLYLIGTTAKKIAESCERNDFHEYVFCDSLEEAEEKAYLDAENGDAVLLSPACASWDMFKSYEERGRIFKEIARGFLE